MKKVFMFVVLLFFMLALPMLLFACDNDYDCQSPCPYTRPPAPTICLDCAKYDCECDCSKQNDNKYCNDCDLNYDYCDCDANCHPVLCTYCQLYDCECGYVYILFCPNCWVYVGDCECEEVCEKCIECKEDPCECESDCTKCDDCGKEYCECEDEYPACDECGQEYCECEDEYPACDECGQEYCECESDCTKCDDCGKEYCECEHEYPACNECGQEYCECEEVCEKCIECNEDPCECENDYYVCDECGKEYCECITTVLYFIITFNSNGGSRVEQARVQNGQTIDYIPVPDRCNYYFLHWELDGQAFDFAAPITASVTLMAVWTSEIITTPPMCNTCNQNQNECICCPDCNFYPCECTENCKNCSQNPCVCESDYTSNYLTIQWQITLHPFFNITLNGYLHNEFGYQIQKGQKITLEINVSVDWFYHWNYGYLYPLVYKNGHPQAVVRVDRFPFSGMLSFIFEFYAYSDNDILRIVIS